MFHRVFCCLAIGNALLAAPARMGKDMTVTQTSAAARIHISLDGDFHLTEPDQYGGKCVVDLMGVQSQWTSTFVKTVGNEWIKVIRVGSYTDKTRIAVDLESPARCTVARAHGGLDIEFRRSPTAKAAASSPVAPHSPPLPAVQMPSPPKATKKPSMPAHAGDVEPKGPTPSTGPPEPKLPSSSPVDPNSIELDPNLALSFMEDKTQDLPYVLQMYRGLVGFGEDDKSLRLLYQAGDTSDWVPVQLSPENASLKNYFPLYFTDNLSTLVQNLRRKYDIPATFLAIALFPRNFLDVIHQQIRRAAAQQGHIGPVTAATIQFAMADTSGIEVKSVK